MQPICLLDIFHVTKGDCKGGESVKRTVYNKAGGQMKRRLKENSCVSEQFRMSVCV